MLRIALAILLFTCTHGRVIAQQDAGRTKSSDADSLYQRFVGQLVTVNENSTAPAATLEISDQPNLKLNLPLFQGFNRPSNSRLAIYLHGKVGATNGFSPLVSKGAWKPNTEGNATALLFGPRSVRFYTNEVSAAVLNQEPRLPLNIWTIPLILNRLNDHGTRNEVIGNLPISQASSIWYGWFSFRVGISHAEYNLYQDGLTAPFADRISDTTVTSENFRLGYSLYSFPSRNNLRPVSFLINLVSEYKTNDNNYNTLTKVDVEQLRMFSGPNDSSIQVTDKKSVAGKGRYVTGSSFNIGGEFNILVSPQGSKLTVGLGAGIARKFFNEQSYSTAAFTVNFPILNRAASGKEAPANLALRAELPDIHSEHQPEGDLDQRARLGFILSVALPNHR